MSLLKVQQLAAAIDTRFRNHLDLSNRGQASLEQTVQSRGLAALAVQLLTREDPAICAAAVIDGFGDNGIDAVLVDEKVPRIIVVQTKFRADGTKTIGLGETRNFLAGIRDLTDERFERFKGRLDKIAPLIGSVLHQSEMRIDAILATTSNKQLSDEVNAALEDERRAMNDPDEILRIRTLNLDELHAFVKDSAAGKSLDLKASVDNWGLLHEPYEAFYGTISANQVVDWYRDSGDLLFERNIRKALGVTQVNQRLIDTLCKDSHHFWYFNNGITVLCQSVKRAGVGAANRRRGELTMKGVSVVNGAQTVMSIAEAAERSPDSLAKAKVWIRVISLEQCPENFASEVTRATNTQNQVVDRDFVALDPIQTRLRHDFALLRKTYVIKRGEDPPVADEGCSVTDATIAMACAHQDPRYAVMAHATPGRLWDTAEDGPYNLLFRRDILAVEVWRLVKAMRRVDEAVSAASTTMTGRSKAVSGQSQRLVGHIVVNMLDRSGIADQLSDWDDQLILIDELAPRVMNLLVEHANRDFRDTHVPTLFKNIGKCRQLVSLVSADLRAGSNSSPPTEPAQHDRPEAPESLLFHLSGRGASARGSVRGTGFVVRAGSQAARNCTPSLLTYQPAAVARREWLIDQKILGLDGSQTNLVLTRDEYFDSPTQAAVIMLGRPVNGRTEWRTDDGLSINQVQQLPHDQQP